MNNNNIQKSRYGHSNTRNPKLPTVDRTGTLRSAILPPSPAYVSLHRRPAKPIHIGGYSSPYDT